MSRDDRVAPLLLGEAWPEDAPGGLNRYLAGLLAALRRGGVDARAVVLEPAAGAPAEVVSGGRASQFLPVRLWRYDRAVRRVLGGSDLVDAHFALYAWWPTVAGRARRLPLVVHFQGPWAAESRSVRGPRWRVEVRRRVERAVYQRAAGVVVLSQASKRVLVEHYGVSPWTVAVVPAAVDLDRFTPGDRRAARAQLGIRDDARVALSVRRLVPRMGLDTLLAAWAKVAATDDGALLVVAGDGPERGRLEALAAHLGVAGSVRFMGVVDDATLVACYRAADTAVVPTRELEGFGLVVLEALACGSPVVVTNAGALPEVVAPLDAGLIVPAGDPDALAERLKGGFGGKWPLPTAQRCRAYAETFTWERVVERHRGIYAAAVGGGDSAGAHRRRVVYLDHCAALSGGELALARLLPALQGVEAHVVLAEEGPLTGVLARRGISSEVLPMAEAAVRVRRDRLQGRGPPVGAVWHTARYVVRLTRRLRRLKPDLVHANSLKAGVYGGLAAKLARVPLVWHVHDRIASDYLPAPAVPVMRAAIGLLADEVVANSRTTLETLGRKGAVIGCPVAPQAGDVPETRSGHDPLRVGIVGRLAPWKGQHVFLEAFARAFPESGAEAVVVGRSLFGEEDYEAELHERAARLRLSPRVDFRGFREDVDAELDRLDVLVHASVIPEPFGQVVLEGMAAGLPVVAANSGGPAEVVTDGVDGLLYPPGDVEALASALVRLVADGALRNRLATAGCRRAERFAPEVIAEEMLEVYRRVLSTGPPPR